MKVSSNKIFIITVILVVASTAILPSIGGYGTQLLQVVVVGAWGVVASITSASSADQNHGLVWTVALGINLLLFLVPAFVVWVATRNKWPSISSGLLIAWCLFYLSSLFFLFPATDGP